MCKRQSAGPIGLARVWISFEFCEESLHETGGSGRNERIGTGCSLERRTRGALKNATSTPSREEGRGVHHEEEIPGQAHATLRAEFGRQIPWARLSRYRRHAAT